MHILLVADGRSAITAGWLRMLSRLECRVSLVSTFPCDPPEFAELAAVLPVGFSSLAGGQVRLSGTRTEKGQAGTGIKRRVIGAFRPALLSARAWLTPLTLGNYQKRVIQIVKDLQPDIVHALRIPFEGMLAAATPTDIPFIVSIWGNDLTLHARTSPFMTSRTKQTLKHANGLLADANRDVRLAKDWGLKAGTPSLVVPGNGGLDLERIQEVIKKKNSLRHSERSEESRLDLPSDRPLVINPRGFRPGSVHQDTFFKSIPQVLEKIPDAFFICTAMQGQPEAEKWVKKLAIKDHVLLLPYLPQEHLWQLYARAKVYVSLSSHDGTPNTFLEALACGCFPVVGDIESLQEWLTDGVNGFLVDPKDHSQAAVSIIRALSDETMHLSATKKNKKMIRQRAEVNSISRQVESFLSRFQ